MTRERTIEQLKLMLRCPEDNLDDEDREAVEVCIKALSAGPCDDCISRQAVIDAISSDRYDYAALDRYVKDLPSVTPQQRTGRWIEEDMFDGDIAYRCSKCDESFCLIDGTPIDNMYNFCPNCGARMEVEE